ncbi:hypothetical protein Zmor_001984 [Zophobas morio]|uniref:Uncharacterized protein n=1 Tax=Zophobas morio TaxID=2755281 RepID=A0AA38MTB0_9CUCU|nr:hypothetical protein Zmor_001984 [Zophobas morio]
MLQVNLNEIYLLQRHFCNQKSHNCPRRHEAHVSGGPAPTGRGFTPWGFYLFHRGPPFLSRRLVLLEFQVERGQHIIDSALSLPDYLGLFHPKTKHKEVAWRGSLGFGLAMEKKPFFDVGPLVLTLQAAKYDSCVHRWSRYPQGRPHQPW